jgi:2'-5' RNA ligase
MKHRTFIAVNLPSVIKQALMELIGDLKRANSDQPIKWVRPEGLHLTLHFLGYLDEKMIDKVKEILTSRTNQIPSFELKLGGISAFPNLTRPRVIFVECQEINGQNLVTLQKNIGQDLEKTGIKIDRRPWHAHITLARIKGPCKFSAQGRPASGWQDLHFKVDNIELMESQLRPDGARYSILESFELKLKIKDKK